jgi:hypothetical protein
MAYGKKASNNSKYGTVIAGKAKAKKSKKARK